MYNSEKYIGECLESILGQTFQDFEVIIVDDCSTDSSFEVVKSYETKFGGRLRLAKTKINSYNGGTPQNIGISLSRGEYLLLLDDDDAITPTAMEEMYFIAKKFDADVVACERFYEIPAERWNDTEFRKNLNPFNYRSGKFVTEPVLMSEDPAEHVMACYRHEFLWNLWSKLIRRDFFVENEIKILDIDCQDMLCTLCVICAAKKIVRVPNVINYYRSRKDSASSRNLEWITGFEKKLHALKVGFAYLDKFLSVREYFKQRYDMKMPALNVYVKEMINYLLPMYSKIPMNLLDEVLRREFGENASALCSYIFSAAIINRTNLLNAHRRIWELESEIRRLKGEE